MSEVAAPEFLTSEQLAEALTNKGLPVTARTVWQWHNDGRIPSAVHEPNRLRFILGDVTAALAANAAAAARKRAKSKK